MHPTNPVQSKRFVTLFGFSPMFAWVCGLALQLQQAQLWHWGGYAAFVVIALSLCALGFCGAIFCSVTSRWRGIFVVLGMFLLGLGSTGLRAVSYMQGALDPALEGRDVRVTGVVSGLPQANESGVRFPLQIESAQWQGQAVRLPPRVNVTWYLGLYPNGDGSVDWQRQSVAPKAGERWHMTLRLKAPHGTYNPHGFDYELWLWEQGVQATGYVRAGSRDTAPQRLEQTWTYPMAWARQLLRERIFAYVSDRQLAGMLTALVVGDQAAIERADWDVFRATGVAHLVSISGLHITMLAWLAGAAVSCLWRRSGRLCLVLPAPTAGLLGAVVLAWLYASFSGWGVPAQRTCVMLVVVAFLRLCGNRWPWPMVWMLACTVVLASDPWAFLQPGFWLSFIAVGVLFATDVKTVQQSSAPLASPNQNQLSRLSRGLKAHAVASVLAMLREQWVITVALAALTLLLFGQLSIVGLFANFLAIPWVTLVITPLSMLGIVLPILWHLAAAAASFLLLCLQWLAGLEWAVFSVAKPPFFIGLLGVLGGVVCVAPWSWRLRVLGVPLLLPVLFWQAPLVPEAEFELLAADIGQGNAVLVRTANHALLYDAGPRYGLESDAGHRVLVPLLNALHMHLDVLVLSHRDTDHVGGAQAVLDRQMLSHQPIQVLSSVEDTHPLQAQQVVQRCAAGQSWRWDGVQFEVLHPQSADYEHAARPIAKPNALSCVLRISNGVRTALLVGDIERAQEERLVQQQARGDKEANALHADVLLVPHHGSNTSSSPIFLDAVRPRWALVQVGYRNRFGHPSEGVLERYAQRHIEVVDSPRCGAMTWRSWRATHMECAREQDLRYWHHRLAPWQHN